MQVLKEMKLEKTERQRAGVALRKMKQRIVGLRQSPPPASINC